jgi:hypothetical protein
MRRNRNIVVDTAGGCGASEFFDPASNGSHSPAALTCSTPIWRRSPRIDEEIAPAWAGHYSGGP